MYRSESYATQLSERLASAADFQEDPTILKDNNRSNDCCSNFARFQKTRHHEIVRDKNINEGRIEKIDCSKSNIKSKSSRHP